MARTDAGSELSRAADVEFAVAGPDDEAGLRALLRDTPTPGAVALRFEREPGYFAGEGVAGAKDTTIVARRGGRVVCMGRCSRRVVYVDGKRREAGYLGELRLESGTRRGLAVLREGYAFWGRHEAARPGGPAEFYFTSVAAGNTRARAVLECGRRIGLPEYAALAELVTVAWPVGLRMRRTSVADDDDGGAMDEDALSGFLDTEARRHALTMPWDGEAWIALRGHGLDVGDFVTVRRAGRIVAAVGVWDQRAWRQTVVAGYSGVLRWGRGLANATAWLAGRPGLPEVGAVLRQACVHPLAIAADATAAEVTELLEKLEACASRRGIEWLVATVAADDALRPALRGRRGGREYGTRLYAVDLPGVETDGVDLRGQRVRPEAGLL